MKVGDTVAVTIGGHTVANAKVSEINDNQAVLIVPATKVIMGIRTELEVPAPVQSNVEHQILGVEQRDQSATVDGTNAANAAETTNTETPATPVETVTPAEAANVADAPSVAPTSVADDTSNTNVSETPSADASTSAGAPSVPEAATGVESA